MTGVPLFVHPSLFGRWLVDEMISSIKVDPGKEPSEWKAVRFADVDGNELFLTRFRNLNDLFGAAMWDTEKKESVKSAFWSMVLEGFTPAFVHLRAAIALSNEPKTPTLNLRSEYDAFYSKLWTAYEHRFGDLLQEMGYKARFLFAESDKRFAEESATFAQQHGIGSDVIAHVKLQRDSWQNELSRIRNKVVLHARTPPETVPEVYKPSTAQWYFDNCWMMAEWFSAILMAKSASPSVELAALPPDHTQGGRRVMAFQFKPGVKFVTPEKP
jgi:hypothetical protein